MAPTTANAEDDDPVLGEWDVFISPELEAEAQLYVLQYLNRLHNDELSAESGKKPVNLRIKQQSKFVEVDVPVNILKHFNRPKGVQWGEALRKTKQIGQKAYGIASGFERAMPRPPRPGPGSAADSQPAPVPTLDDDNYADYIEKFEDANEKGHVFNAQTYGGQILQDDGRESNYMMCSFSKLKPKEVHFTKLSGLVQMRTQFHHLDAVAQLEAANRRREKEQQEGARPAEPKAFMPTVKKAGGDTAAELTQAFMKAANQEAWSKFDYEDANAPIAWHLHEVGCFVNDSAVAPKLHAERENSEYLDTVSTPSGGKGLKKRLPQKRQELVEISDESDEEEIAEET